MNCARELWVLICRHWLCILLISQYHVRPVIFFNRNLPFERYALVIKILYLAFYELKMRLQDLRTLIVLIVGPPALLYIIGYAAAPLWEQGSFIQRFTVALVNNDQSLETRTVLNYLENSEQIDEIFEIRRGEYEQAIAWLEEDAVAAVIIIPPRFGEYLAYSRSATLEVIPNHRRPLQFAVVDAVLNSMSNLVTATYSGINTVYHYLRETGISREQLDARLGSAVIAFTLQSIGRTRVLQTVTLSPLNHLTPVEYYSVSLGLIFLLAGGMTAFRPAFMGKDVTLRLMAQGTGPLQLIMARFLSLALYLALPLTALFLLLSSLVETFRQGNPLYLAIIFIAVIAAAASLFIFITYLFSNVAVANLAALVIIIFMSLAGGSIIPLAYLPPWLEAVHLFSFNRWAAQGLYHALFIPGSPVEVMTSAAILTALTAVLLFLSSYLLKRKVR